MIILEVVSGAQETLDNFLDFIREMESMFVHSLCSAHSPSPHYVFEIETILSDFTSYC